MQIDKVAVLGPLRKMLNYELLPETDLLAWYLTWMVFYRLFQVLVDALNGGWLHHPVILWSRHLHMNYGKY